MENGIFDAADVADLAATDIGTIDITLGTYNSRLTTNESDIVTLNTATGDSATDITDLQNYNTWRSITTDPITAVIAAEVDNIFIEWLGTVTVLLPSNPSVNARVRIADAGAGFATNNLNLDRNGVNIMGNSTNYIIDYDNASIELCYTGGTYGWVVTRAV